MPHAGPTPVPPAARLPLEVPADAALDGASAPDTFAVVALTGSAGSLGAFEAFFRALPAAPGVAIVVVTHLSATAEITLPSVLQQFTPLPVVSATDGLRVQTDHVYVIPPGHDLAFHHGMLRLLAPTATNPHLPIDVFLETLALDAGPRAVAIICSGMGADGAAGVKLILENAGMVMVQEPATAAFEAMPTAALAAGTADFVLPPAQLPGALLAYLADSPTARADHRIGVIASAAATPESADLAATAEAIPELPQVYSLIKARTGHDFTHYKRSTVLRRVERRMSARQCHSLRQYVQCLQETPDEVDTLFRELLIGVTQFFRDPEAFEALRRHLPALLAAKPSDGVVRVWAPGCSTGEEAYSLAMLLLETLDTVAPERYLRLQLFASDINPGGIELARAGLYPETIAAEVSESRRRRFFTRVAEGYRVRKELRDVVIFTLHNINKDAPFMRLDLLVCRNLLIYLSAELQKNLLPVFHYSLNPGGILFLGPSEHFYGLQNLFMPLDARWKIARRTEGATVLNQVFMFPFVVPRPMPSTDNAAANPLTARTPAPGASSFATLVQRALLHKLVPPAVVINPKGDILYVNGRTGRYLEPAPGVGAMNLFEMGREELNFELSGAVHRAVHDGEDVVLDRVSVRTDDGYQLLRLSVRCLTEPDTLAGLLVVVFEDQPTPPAVKNGATRLATTIDRETLDLLGKELHYTKQRLQTTIEEMESSLDELKSTNEELQSSNEELQSTNEEAMTNKEEMQSLNEELMTLNAQYRSKTEELGEAANDMKNLLDSTEIATIFLDNNLIIKRFTPPVTRIIQLLPTDVGRSITHFATHLRHEQLAADIEQVIARLVPLETTIETTAGEWYALRILPYRTLDNYISGAVITFTDVTGLKTLEGRLQESARFAESIVATIREPLLVLDPELRVLTASRAFLATFGLEGTTPIKGHPLTRLNGGAWQHPALHAALRNLLGPDGPPDGFDDLTWTADFVGLGRRRLTVYGRPLQREGHATGSLLLGVQAVEEEAAAA